MGALVKYEAACRAVSEAKSVDEVRGLRNQAEALRAYARQAKNRQLETDAAEIRFRAERRIGELMEAQRNGIGMAPPGPRKIGSESDPIPSLMDAGIDKHLADRARKLAAIPSKEFDGIVSEWRGRIEQENERVSVDLLAAGARHVRGTFGTGENEWYTPVEYLEAARACLGAIDLDPASSEQANIAVRASRFFSLEDDGLQQDWNGRVWLNPPYAQPFIAQFADKMISELLAGRVDEAIMLTHNYTDTTWFHKLAEISSGICFTRGRIRFVAPSGELAAPTQGQAFFYFGPNLQGFLQAFECFGFVVVKQ